MFKQKQVNEQRVKRMVTQMQIRRDGIIRDYWGTRELIHYLVMNKPDGIHFVVTKIRRITTII